MIHCKKHFIAACCLLMIPAISFAEAPVVDDSDNFAIMDEQQSAVRPKYEQPLVDKAEYDDAKSDNYQMDMAQDEDGPEPYPFGSYRF